MNKEFYFDEMLDSIINDGDVLEFVGYRQHDFDVKEIFMNEEKLQEAKVSGFHRVRVNLVKDEEYYIPQDVYLQINREETKEGEETPIIERVSKLYPFFATYYPEENMTGIRIMASEESTDTITITFMVFRKKSKES